MLGQHDPHDSQASRTEEALPVLMSLLSMVRQKAPTHVGGQEKTKNEGIFPRIIFHTYHSNCACHHDGQHDARSVLLQDI